MNISWADLSLGSALWAFISFFLMRTIESSRDEDDEDDSLDSLDYLIFFGQIKRSS